MAELEVIKWSRSVKDMPKKSIIQLQLSVHCHLQGIHISPADLDCLTLLGLNGKVGLTAFCSMLLDEKIFGSIQSSRNAIGRLVRTKNLIIKEGRNRKKISLEPSLKIQSKGNILVDIKCFSPAQ